MTKVVKIAHLYYDLLNLYGEVGNVRALTKFIERAGLTPEVHFLTIDDKIDFEKYDIYYLGEGSEENQMLVLKDLMKYKKDIKKAIDNNKMFIATGNSMELFGKKIRHNNGLNTKCLEIFDYYSYEEENRLVSEIVYNFSKLEENKGRRILGFKNCICNIKDNDDNRLFDYSDSFVYKNFYGMNIVGPVLIRNPYFTNYLLELLLQEKGIDKKLNTDSIEFKSYHYFVDNIMKVS